MGIKKYIYAISAAVISAAVIFGAGFGIAYKLGEAKFTEYQLKVVTEKAELQDKINKLNAENRKRVNELEVETQTLLAKQKEQHEKTIRDIRRDFKPSGVYDCSRSNTSLSRTNDDTANLVCYRESELRRKIERSLAIGNEADEMNLKCNALHKLIKGYEDAIQEN